MQLTLTNRQRSLKLDLAALRRLATCLCALAASTRRAKTGVKNSAENAAQRAAAFNALEEIRITLCGDAETSRVHAAVFSDPSTTDVITIPYAPTPAAPAFAEIFVNTAQALRVAGGDNAARELALYIAHGFDHLAGHDDHTPRGYESMRRRELSWLETCEKQGLLEILKS